MVWSHSEDEEEAGDDIRIMTLVIMSYYMLAAICHFSQSSHNAVSSSVSHFTGKET